MVADSYVPVGQYFAKHGKVSDPNGTVSAPNGGMRSRRSTPVSTSRCVFVPVNPPAASSLVAITTWSVAAEISTVTDVDSREDLPSASIHFAKNVCEPDAHQAHVYDVSLSPSATRVPSSQELPVRISSVIDTASDGAAQRKLIDVPSCAAAKPVGAAGTCGRPSSASGAIRQISQSSSDSSEPSFRTSAAANWYERAGLRPRTVCSVALTRTSSSQPRSFARRFRMAVLPAEVRDHVRTTSTNGVMSVMRRSAPGGSSPRAS